MQCTGCTSFLALLKPTKTCMSCFLLLKFWISLTYRWTCSEIHNEMVILFHWLKYLKTVVLVYRLKYPRISMVESEGKKKLLLIVLMKNSHIQKTKPKNKGKLQNCPHMFQKLPKTPQVFKITRVSSFAWGTHGIQESKSFTLEALSACPQSSTVVRMPQLCTGLKDASALWRMPLLCTALKPVRA